MGKDFDCSRRSVAVQMAAEHVVPIRSKEILCAIQVNRRSVCLIREVRNKVCQCTKEF